MKRSEAFTKAFEALRANDITDQWLYFFRHVEKMDFIPDVFIKLLKKACSLLDERSVSEKELDVQHRQKEFIFIQNSSLALAEDKGFKKAVAKGREQAKKAIAKNMLSARIDVAQIAQLTGLSMNEIEKLS